MGHRQHEWRVKLVGLDKDTTSQCKSDKTNYGLQAVGIMPFRSGEQTYGPNVPTQHWSGTTVRRAGTKCCGLSISCLLPKNCALKFWDCRRPKTSEHNSLEEGFIGVNYYVPELHVLHEYFSVLSNTCVPDFRLSRTNGYGLLMSCLLPNNYALKFWVFQRILV
ncbi:hypothetical protein TNCV_3390581 [Trichonephila clavipes]|nr:hypothetical protein TNCV_3390581 [Trichonephila clavipes]